MKLTIKGKALLLALTLIDLLSYSREDASAECGGLTITKSAVLNACGEIGIQHVALTRSAEWVAARRTEKLMLEHNPNLADTTFNVDYLFGGDGRISENRHRFFKAVGDGELTHLLARPPVAAVA